MKLVADLHIHSHYSRATSKNLTFEHLTRWAQLKGIQVVATGDITHPGWLAEMQEKLAPAEVGLYRLKDEYLPGVQAQVPPACQGPVHFMLGGEISNIYKRDGKTRKVHNLVFAPSFAAVERLQGRLEKIGNIRADGRPILGLDSRDLLEIVLDTDPLCALIPAHIWTPWFSLLGSKSGFDTVAACYGDLTPHIFALETGLSSDPPMNWRVSALDAYVLVSNSDAHSPEKLGREATLFDSELSYPALFAALKSGDPQALGGTVEFFPEEGKYHFDGHRACGIAWDPATTQAHGGVCPACGKEVTIGVLNRVATLADRPAGRQPARTQPYISLIPLPELLGEVYGVGAGSRQVEAEYTKLLGRLGPELTIQRAIPLADIAAAGGERLAEGIGRMRRGEVSAEAGYDGEYGVVRVFGGAGQISPAQLGLLAGDQAAGSGSRARRKGAGAQEDALPREQADEVHGRQDGLSPARDMRGTDEPPAVVAGPSNQVRETGAGFGPPGEKASQASLFALDAASTWPEDTVGAPHLAGLNDEQRAAVLCTGAPLIVVAGPGTGKTRTLTVRIAHLILDEGVAPEAALAITFTNKAAGEMAERLAALLGPATAGRVTIKTFHAFGALLLRSPEARSNGIPRDFVLFADDDRRRLLRQVRPDWRQAELDTALASISAAKNHLLAPDAPELEAVETDAPGFRQVYGDYEAALVAAGGLDFDDLIVRSVRLLETRPAVLAGMRARYRWISVDEYQDVNQAQYRLLQLLAGGGANLCVIGDPDQAIYGFRGADRRYFLSFASDYPGAVSLHLDRNYRSTQLILDAAAQVIGRGEAHAHRGASQVGPSSLRAAEILADFAQQVKLEVHCAASDRAEAEYVVHQIEQMVGGTSYFSLDSGRVAGSEPSSAARPFSDFAVLYRLAAQSRLLAEAFERSGIPYQTAGQVPFYSHKPVQEVLAYLWLLRNPGSSAHLSAVLNTGQPAADYRAAAQVTEYVRSGGKTLPEALTALGAAGGLSSRQRERVAALAGFWPELARDARSAPVAALIDSVAAFLAHGAASESPLLRELSQRALAYGDRLPDFLEDAVLHSETDAYDARADRVALMTLHAAKGLEFPVVFIAGCEEGLLPYERQGETADVDEERRLFYVGMTRARQKLVLTQAKTRFLYGRRLENAPSRFVADIESALKEVMESKRRAPDRPEAAQLSLF